MPKKPIKYGIQFYAIIVTIMLVTIYPCWQLSITPSKFETCTFLSYNKTFEADPALWTLQMSHQTKKCPDPSGKRHCFNVFHHCHVNTNGFNAWLDLAVTSSNQERDAVLCLSQWEVPSQQVVPVTKLLDTSVTKLLDTVVSKLLDVVNVISKF